MEKNSEDIMFSKNVVEFATVANEYCKFVENTKALSKHNFIDYALKILSLLYLKSLTLPDSEHEEEGEVEKFVSEMDWSRVQQAVSEKLGIHDTFISVISQTQLSGNETEEAELSECFADIYQDLKNFSGIYRLANRIAINGALWECKYNFRHYWGARLLSLLSNLHPLIFGDEDLDDNIIRNQEEYKKDESIFGSLFHK